MNKRIIFALSVVVLPLLCSSQGRAQDPFYKGKTITILAGTGAVQDEAVIADGKQKQLEFDPSTAEELDRLAKEVVNQPPDTVAQMKKLLGK